ncbi:hypothetical protein FRC04_011220 [Tulasnella sp. 424]|nr:hypothetical protein FRC04_011220 [Tulasnella sp. 424]
MREHNDLPYINQLPPELLGLIILQHNHWGSYWELLSLRGVCKFWLEVIDGTPELWIRLSLSFNVGLISLIIKNSKSLPLMVWYDEDGYLGDDQPALQERITSILSRTAMSSGRWRSLSYTASSESNHSQILGLPLHNLQDLDISLSGNLAHTAPLNAPNLKTISVHRCSLNWSSISHLRLLNIHQNTEGPTVEAIKNILKASPDLEVLTICCNWANLDIPVDPNPINLPKLQDIHFADVSVKVYSHLLNLIVAPNLATFSFIGVNKSTSQSEDFTPIFAAAGRFIGSNRDCPNSSSFALGILSLPSKLYIKIRDGIVGVQTGVWSDGGVGLNDRLRYTAAALEGFGKTFSNKIKNVGLRSYGNGDLGSYCRILHSYLPAVEELNIAGLPDEYADVKAVMETLSMPSSPEEGSFWLLPNLVSLRLRVSTQVQHDDILKIVEARRANTGAKSINHITLHTGQVNRAVFEKLKGFVECLELVEVKII